MRYLENNLDLFNMMCLFQCCVVYYENHVVYWGGEQGEGGVLIEVGIIHILLGGGS